jgi:NADH dehydrogenase
MASVLVTGASGFVGSYVVPALLDAGHDVAALVRSDEAGARVRSRLSVAPRARVELRRGDVTKLETLSPAMEGIDAVVHLVAIPRDLDGGATLRLVNTEGTRNVITAMKATGVRRLVHQGALGVVDDPSLQYASSKAKAERLVAESGLDWTIMRPSLLFGERDGFFNIIASLVRLSPGVVPMAGRGSSRFQPLAVTDAARAIEDVLARPDTIGRTYELGGPRYWTYREIVREVLRAMGARRIVIPMPVPLVMLVARSAELARLPFPVASDQLRQLRLDNVTSLDAVPSAFGFEPLDMEGRLHHLRRRPADQEPR